MKFLHNSGHEGSFTHRSHGVEASFISVMCLLSSFASSYKFYLFAYPTPTLPCRHIDPSTPSPTPPLPDERLLIPDQVWASPGLVATVVMAAAVTGGGLKSTSTPWCHESWSTTQTAVELFTCFAVSPFGFYWLYLFPLPLSSPPFRQVHPSFPLKI